jgi:hypothetical protein
MLARQDVPRKCEEKSKKVDALPQSPSFSPAHWKILRAWA